MKRAGKICIDVAMYAIFLYLMSYRAGRGLFLHGVWGCVLFVLFLLHHLLNLRWYGGLRKGKYSPAHIFFTGIDVLLFAAMLAMAASSLMMSGDVFSFSPFFQTQTARTIHTCSTAWGFVLAILHVGLHTHAPLVRLQKKLSSTIFGYVYVLLFVIVLVAGLYCFSQSSLWRAMFLLPKENTAFSSLDFYGEQLIITLAACQLVHLTMRAFQSKGA